LSSELRPLVFLLGPTGSGKSAAALGLAAGHDGEIVGCDSQQVYRGFDIGTDKPSTGDRVRIPHHLIDIADPATQFNAADYASLASEAIAGIVRRGRLPLVVGGTGLYFRALEDGLFPGPGRDEALRRRLEEEALSLGLEALWSRLGAVDPASAARIGKRDKIRIIRALEVHVLTGVPLSEHVLRTEGRLAGFRVAKFALLRPRAELVRRIEERVERMFASGLVAEVEGLLARGVPESAPPFRGLGYRSVLRYLRKDIGLPEAVEETKVETRRYAKRQMTWFRKMRDVRWLAPEELEPALAGWKTRPAD